MANFYRPLEVVIESALGLEDVNHVSRMKPYAVVYTWDIKNNLRSSKEISSADAEGGSNPTGNFKVKFNIDIAMARENSFALVVKLRSCRRTHGVRDKDIGEVHVLIKELLEGAVEKEKRMSRSIDTSSDDDQSNGTDQQGQGELTFSYKFTDPTADDPTLLNIRKKKSRRHVIKKLSKLLGPVVLEELLNYGTDKWVCRWMIYSQRKAHLIKIYVGQWIIHSLCTGFCCLMSFNVLCDSLSVLS